MNEARTGFHPKLSEDELLAIICQLGPEASDISVWRALSARLGRQISLDRVRGRLHRLNAAGLAAFSPRRYLGSRGESEPVRLTALGVERLQALQRAPLAPSID